MRSREVLGGFQQAELRDAGPRLSPLSVPRALRGAARCWPLCGAPQCKSGPGGAPWLEPLATRCVAWHPQVPAPSRCLAAGWPQASCPTSLIWFTDLKSGSAARAFLPEARFCQVGAYKGAWPVGLAMGLWEEELREEEELVGENWAARGHSIRDQQRAEGWPGGRGSWRVPEAAERCQRRRDPFARAFTKPLKVLVSLTLCFVRGAGDWSVGSGVGNLTPEVALPLGHSLPCWLPPLAPCCPLQPRDCCHPLPPWGPGHEHREGQGRSHVLHGIAGGVWTGCPCLGRQPHSVICRSGGSKPLTHFQSTALPVQRSYHHGVTHAKRR